MWMAHRGVLEIDVPCALLDVALHRVHAIAGEDGPACLTDHRTNCVVDGKSMLFGFDPLGLVKTKKTPLNKVYFFCTGSGYQRKWHAAMDCSLPGPCSESACLARS